MTDSVSATSGGALDFSTPTVGGSALPQAASPTSTSSSLFQGSALPSITTTQQQATTTPGFYTDYLNNIATGGASALDSAAYQGATANQTAAFNQVGANVGNYQPGLNTATSTLNNAMSLNPTSTAQNYIGTGLSAPTGAQAATPFTMAAAGLSGAAAAQPYLQAGTQSAATNVGQYMNPYTQDVVNSIGALNQENIQQNLSPGITAGAVGSGQFGSQRGAQALALGIQNADTNALAQQNQALQAGYTQALTASQQQNANELAAGSTAGALTNQQAATLGTLGATQGSLQNTANQNYLTAGQTVGSLGNTQVANTTQGALASGTLAGQQQQYGLNDVNAEATLGAQQQAINQAQNLFPMTALQQYGTLLQGQTIPTSTSQSATGPIPGAYSASPLAQLAGVASIAGGVSGTSLGSSIGSGLTSLYNSLTGGNGSSTTSSTPAANGQNSSGTDTSGNPINTSAQKSLTGTPITTPVQTPGAITDGPSGGATFGPSGAGSTSASASNSGLGLVNPNQGVDLNSQQLSNVAAFYQQNAGNPQALVQAMTQYGVSGADLAAATGQSPAQIAATLIGSGAAPQGFGGLQYSYT